MHLLTLRARTKIALATLWRRASMCGLVKIFNSIPSVQLFVHALKARPHLFLAAGIALPSLAATLLVSCSSLDRMVMAPPAVPGATFVGNKACYQCHTNITRVFPSSPHARLHFEGSN